MHGRRGLVSLSGTAIGRVTAFSYDESADSVEATAMGDTAKSYEGGLVDGSGTVDFRFSQTDSGQDLMLTALRAGTAVTLDLVSDSADTSGTNVGFSGSVVVNSFNYTQSFDDTINGSFGYQGVLTSYSGA